MKKVNATPAAKVSLRIASHDISVTARYEKYLICFAFCTAPAK